MPNLAGRPQVAELKATVYLANLDQLTDIMNKEINAILIHPDDNVVTVTEALDAGHVAQYEKDGDVVSIIVKDDIPKYHKIALADLKINDPVYKYGQLIGETTKAIYKGSHVHDHNITSIKRA